ncbi:MAG: helix-turn-helix domain-containing protein [Bdellovibrionales bacterium]|nr:helix-turn-helix domain-containing protein [Bdellovibrionales bacterium]
MKLTTKSALHHNLGQYLREKRESAGFTQAQIAQRLGYSSPQFVSNFERGLCSPPLKNLKVLVKLYHVDAGEVIRLILDEQKSVLTGALSGQKSKSK